MLKKTLYGAEARAKLLSGVKKIAAAVKVTLGPMGRNVLISQSMVVDYGIHNLPIHVTKDGYTTTRAFEINDDPFEQAGVLMIKEAAQKSVDQAGDGTTTTVVLAEAIFEKAIEYIANGGNPVELKRSIDKGGQEVVAQLKQMAIPIKGNIERIRQIATISANNDTEMGDLIADAFAKIGEEGIIDLEPGQSVNTEIRIADGYKWDKSWVSPHFITNKEKQVCEFENPIILLYDKRITHHTQIVRPLELVMKTGRPLLIVCEDAVEEGLATLAINHLRGSIKICVVKAPEFNERRREAMEDIALLTGATYISDTKGIDIKEIESDHFGHAKKVLVTKDETVIIGGMGDKEGVENLLNELKMNLTQAKNENESAPIERRIAKLKGGVAVISVGAATETEMKEKLDRYDDAVRAVKAALSEGYIVGGGTAFLRVKTSSDIINSVLSIPLWQICINSGKEKSAARIIHDVSSFKNNVGYNAKADQVMDLIDAGVIDPVKVLRCAITNAASSAGMLITTETLICDTM
jgi:chaperonin GroEL